MLTASVTYNPTFALIFLCCYKKKRNENPNHRPKGKKVSGGGVLSGKVGTGMCGPDRVHFWFWPLRFTNDPFFI